MPGFNRTGPLGQGPMTGGGRGYCNPANRGVPFLGSGIGFGRRWGRGFRFGAAAGWGRGYGRFYGPMPYDVDAAAYPVPTADEKTVLKREAEQLKKELDAVKKRLDELSDQSSG